MYECVYVYSCGVLEGKLNVLGFILCGWGGTESGFTNIVWHIQKLPFSDIGRISLRAGLSYLGPTGVLPVSYRLPGSYWGPSVSYQIPSGFLLDSRQIPTGFVPGPTGSYQGPTWVGGPTEILPDCYWGPTGALPRPYPGPTRILPASYRGPTRGPTSVFSGSYQIPT